jgi:predicted enzyme related to lactoylglutathione lyase
MELPEAAVKMGAPPHWMAHVQVANVDATVEKVKSLGGKIYNGPEDVPTVGRFAIVADPQGAAISVFTPEKPMERHDLGKPGEFAWNELVTSDLEAGWSFYEKVFGWKKVEDMDMGPMGTYRTFGLGEEMVGGMMKAPDGMPMPTAWLYYVGVDDLDAAIARATKQGAKVISGPMDIPGGGRIAQLSTIRARRSPCTPVPRNSLGPGEVTGSSKVGSSCGGRGSLPPPPAPSSTRGAEEEAALA